MLQYIFIGLAFSARCHKLLQLRNLLTSKVTKVVSSVFSFALGTKVLPKKTRKQIKMIICANKNSHLIVWRRINQKVYKYKQAELRITIQWVLISTSFTKTLAVELRPFPGLDASAHQKVQGGQGCKENLGSCRAGAGKSDKRRLCISRKYSLEKNKHGQKSTYWLRGMKMSPLYIQLPDYGFQTLNCQVYSRYDINDDIMNSIMLLLNRTGLTRDLWNLHYGNFLGICCQPVGKVWSL